MDLIVHSDVFHSALANVSAAMVDSVQLDVYKSMLVFTAANAVMTLCVDSMCEGSEKITCKIPGKQILEYLIDVPQGKLTLSFDLPTKLTIKHGRNKASFQLAQDPVPFAMPNTEIQSNVVVRGAQLASLVENVREFCLADDTRYYATGAFLWTEDDVLHMVASDSQRMAKASLKEVTVDTESEGGVIVPRRVLEELKRVGNANPNTDFRLVWSQEKQELGLSSEAYQLHCKCIAGAYPPWKGACPGEIKYSVELPRQELLDLLRLATRCADKTNGIVHLNFKGEELEISSSGSNKEGIHIMDAYSGSVPFEVLYQGTLLACILILIDEKTVNLEWESLTRPVRITGEEKENFFLLVPTRY